MTLINKKIFLGVFFLAIAFVAGVALPHQALASASSTSFTVTAASATYGGTLNYVTATLAASGTPIVGKTVNFMLAGMSVGATTTNSSGIAKLLNPNILAIDAASYPTGLKATFAGDSHYNTSNGTAALTISQAPLTVSGVTASNKVYDRLLTATVNAKGAVLIGVQNGENITLATTSTGTFSTRGAGVGKTVTATLFSLGGTATTSNYSLAQPTATANITPAILTINNITASNKSYNGTTTATLDATHTTISGVVAGDTVTYSTSSVVGVFSSKNVGTGLTVTISGLTFNTATTSNYSLTQPSTTANITTRAITVTAAANTKTYDGLLTAAGVPTVTSGSLAAGDTGTFTETYDNKTVGTTRVLTPAGTIADHLSADMTANYNITFATISTGAITAKILVGSITAGNKTYDGSTSATISSRSLSGVIGSDDVSYSGGTATFNDANVGSGKTVTAVGLSLSGADAGNYTVNSTAATTANITSASSGSGITVYCSSVTYGDWGSCASGYQYRNVLNQDPSNCILTSVQQSSRTKVCETVVSSPATSSAASTAEIPASSVATMDAEATAVINLSYQTLNTDLESQFAVKASGLKGFNSLTAAEKEAIVKFSADGTASTKILGAGERLGVVSSYFAAYGKMPTTSADFTDVIKIANGRWPQAESPAAIKRAQVSFKAIYLRDANMSQANDNAAVTIMAYGLRSAARNLSSEKAAIQNYKAIFHRSPATATAWDAVRAIAYSGAKR